MATNYPEVKVDSQIDDMLKAISDNLDLTEAPPINQKRLVTFFNHFVITMVDFLNSFSQSCSYRLFKFEQKINKIEAELCLLESKLNSIPELADMKSEAAVSTNKESDVISASSVPSQDSPNESEETKVREETVLDPRIAKYQKMVQVGVPLEAVKAKMRLEGIDTDLLK
ncbi:coiled-coil domain containing 53 [Rhodnius prolixus]|uniref:Coiled-coil domain-containing protein 53 n=2 Tax=Rhodnius TaxID=13248 RepID=T1HEQ1_RHOPR